MYNNSNTNSSNNHYINNTNNTNTNGLSHLRQYRFIKKPQLGESTSTSNSSFSTPGQSISVPSGSKMNRSPISQPQNNVRTFTFKRIRPMSSESETENSPVKKVAFIAKPAEKPKFVITSPPDSITREKRLQNMVQMFPDISALIIKATLTKHNWSEEKARDELLDFDPEQQEINKSVRPLPFNMTYIPTAKTYSRIKKIGNGKKGKRRNDSDDGSDSEYDESRKKNDKVFDSDDDSDTTINNDLSGDKKNVYDFLNTARMSELQQLQGCSLKKAEEIIACRPFRGWVDMVEKFQKSKNLNTDILNSTQEILRVRNNVVKLMKKCSSLAQQMESAVAAGAGLLKQPRLLEPSLKLASYQIVGLNWLAVLHAQKVNGILADEMGLGKTVQVIAFLAHLKETNQSEGPHLIVVPSSTLDNWSVEFARFCPTMNVAVYYGNQDERRTMRINWARGGFANVDVIITTYNLVSSSPEERKMFRVTPIHYVVFDEAHMLKNMATQRYENLIKIKATNRLLLTGTPLQNNLLELMSLLCFIMPHLFANNAEDIKSVFRKNAKSGPKKTTANKKEDDEDDVPPFEQSQINQAKRIMKPFLLRRLKRDVLKDLPTKSDLIIKCPLIPTQQVQYKSLIDSFRSREKTINSSNEQSGISMMMDLRKLSNHPLLMRNYYDDSKITKIAKYLANDTFYKESNKNYIYDDLRFMSDFQIHQLTQQYKSVIGLKVPDDLILKSGKFQKLDELLPKLKQEGHRVLIFSQFTMMLDILEPFLKLRGYQYLRLDGSTAVTLRQELIDQYNEESDLFIFLLSTKAGGLGINLTAADTVIIHDIDFNPYNDKQAEDRCHRMGQKRPVTIYRMISAGTIEEGIYQVAQEKLNLERDVTNSDENEPQEMRNVVRLLQTALGYSPTK